MADPAEKTSDLTPLRGSWWAVFALVNLIGLLNFSIIHTDALATGRSHYDWREYFINEFSGAYTAFVFIPILVFLWKHYPVFIHWGRRLPVYIGVTLVVGATHTTLMLGSRTLLFPLVLHREFNYGNLGYRYLMEFHKQVVWIWLTFAIAAGIHQIRRHQQNKLKAANLQAQLAYSRLEQMRQQINPHFLFNSLNLISSKIYEDVEAADQLISDLSDLLRESLDMSKRPTTSLKTELGFLNNYLSIMQSRFADRITIEQSIDPDCLDTEIPSLILQPIVENSFKHRLEARQGNVHLQITCKCSAEVLEIRVSDHFSPVSQLVSDPDRKASKSTGTGLRNIRERLECIYGSQAVFEYKARDDLNFLTLIRIPKSRPQFLHD